MKRITEPKPEDGAYMTITSGLSGHFAVHMWWNPDQGGFWEPWTTGLGRYETPFGAYQEAIDMAETEGIPLLEDPRWPK